ncbi:MAG TPA: cytochrome c biogenesis protein ResB [Candidatus Limnocylindrales bacterium]
MATVTLGSQRAETQLNPLNRLGLAVWHTLTNVKFAVLQISILAVAGVIGAVMIQIQPAALHDPSGYASEMAKIHAAYDGTLSAPVVDLLQRVGLFQVFAAPWFVFLLTLLVVSIVVCTIDRIPDLWRKERLVRVVQAPPFYDLRMDNRAEFSGIDEAALDDVQSVLRRSRFRVREQRVAEPGGADVVNVYGDKNQYFRLATLFTHLGLILFLGAAALTTAFGFETVVFLGKGQTAPVQAVGTPDNLLVKNVDFEAPQRADGSFLDFSTDLAVYQNGVEVAHKTIEVNDPLEFDGYAFHQNTFGPAETVQITDPSGALVWDGPILLDGALAGNPQGFITIPGSDMGLLLVLNKADDGSPVLALTGITQDVDAGQTDIAFLNGLGLGQTSPPQTTAGYTITWSNAGAYTGMVIKRDPGQGLVWVAYLSLITGLVLTFYFPRRRFWARYENGKLQVAMLADRYVDAEREFGKLVESISGRIGVVAGTRPTP